MKVNYDFLTYEHTFLNWIVKTVLNKLNLMFLLVKFVSSECSVNCNA